MNDFTDATPPQATRWQKAIFYLAWIPLGAFTLFLFMIDSITTYGVTWKIDGGTKAFAILILEFGAMWIHASLIHLNQLRHAYHEALNAWRK